LLNVANEYPEFLFVSNQDDTKLTRISPKDENLTFFEVIPEKNQIIFKTQRDIDNNKIFDDNNEVIWYITTYYDNEWVKNEIITKDKRNEIEKLYFNQWLLKK
jgi:hypothetical protein